MATSKRVSALVERALRDYPETRNSDKKLVVKVWELQSGQTMNPQLKEFILHKAIFPDTITRARRKFQEHGKYPASQQVEARRYEKFEQVKEVAPRTTDPSQLGLEL